MKKPLPATEILIRVTEFLDETMTRKDLRKLIEAIKKDKGAGMRTKVMNDWIKWLHRF